MNFRQVRWALPHAESPDSPAIIDQHSPIISVIPCATRDILRRFVRTWVRPWLGYKMSRPRFYLTDVPPDAIPYFLKGMQRPFTRSEEDWVIKHNGRFIRRSGQWVVWRPDDVRSCRGLLLEEQVRQIRTQYVTNVLVE
jgi:hypothetical protein